MIMIHTIKFQLRTIFKLGWSFIRAISKGFHKLARATIKPILLKQWARQLANEKHRTTNEILKKSEPRNLCGIGGDKVRPIFKSWNDIWNDTHTVNPIDPTKYRLKNSHIKSLFIGYFGPLESYCEQYFTGDFALWYNQKGVYLIIFHEYDQTYFALKWGGKLPHFNNLAQNNNG
jgi:hypothetical protein